MPRRPGGLAPAPVVAVATALGLLAGCQTSDIGTGGCQLSQQVTLAASPLTLLPDAHLEKVADGYALWGVADDHVTALWALIDGAGAMGQEQRLVIPAGAGGPWLAFTAAKGPGDTVLVVQAVAAANGADLELRVSTVPVTGAPTPPPVGAAVATIAGGVAAGPPLVALAATSTGAHATLAWVDPKAGVRALTLSPTGQPMGAPFAVADPGAFDCLSFQPGHKALTLVHHRFDDPSSRVPALVITELDEAGAIDGTLELLLDSHAARCSRLHAVTEGYVIAFQDPRGSWLGVYHTATKRLHLDPFAEALAFGSADLQPPLVGLAPTGSDFAVVFSRPHGGELWRVSGQGSGRLGVLTFPTAQGDIGLVSTQPVAGGLTATYADYISRSATSAAGKRFFLSATCL